MVEAMPVDGADVSHHQGALNLEEAKKRGLQWLYHKATEGSSVLDGKYGSRRAQAKASHLPFGAYHFARPDSARDAIDEARYFIKHADPHEGDLCPALDLEVATSSGVSAKQWAKDFLEEVERLLSDLGLVGTPVHYGPGDFGEDWPYLRWVPHYNSTNTPPNERWDVWQFSDGKWGVPNHFPGLGHVDLNTMRKGLNVPMMTLRSAHRPKPINRYIAWNDKITNPPANVARTCDYFIREYNPTLIGLDEATHCHGHLDGMGMNVFQHAAHSHGHMAETANTALLVRDDVKAKPHDITLTKTWRGPVHGWEHDPRVYRWTVVDPNGPLDTAVLMVHQPFGDAQQRESVEAVVDWFKSVKTGRSAIAMGDWNTSKTKLKKALKAAGLRHFKIAGSGIDLIVFRNCTVKVKRLGKHDSDHHAMMYDVTPKAPAKKSRGKGVDKAIDLLRRGVKAIKGRAGRKRKSILQRALELLRSLPEHR